MKTYHAIVEKSYDLIREEYQKLTYDSRVKQREASKDFPKYLAVMNEYLNNSEALIIAGQGLISKKVGLGEKKLEESEVALMERGLAQNLLMIQSQLRARIKYIINYLQIINSSDKRCKLRSCKGSHCLSDRND
jgi:homogentisate 1,2-dioxygenase